MMERHSFLGACSESGFISLFDPFVAGRRHVYVLKAGPGTGKSTLMRALAARAKEKGLEAEEIHCSSDPDSLDAVWIPALDTCMLDGTPPHVVEPPLPGAIGTIVNLYPFWDRESLQKNTAAIRESGRKMAHLHTRATLYLAAAGRLQRELSGIGFSLLDRRRLLGYTERLLSRCVRPTGHAPQEEKRFFAAITPKGRVFFSPPTAEGEKQLVIDDDYGVATRLLESVRVRALKQGHRVVSGYSPLIPDALTHLILPEAGLSFCLSNSLHKTEPKPYCRIRASRFLKPKQEAEVKKRAAFLRRSRDEIIQEAVGLLAACKEEHDRLELIYRAAVDFPALSAYGEKLLREIIPD